jgi:hypothetical protein
MTLARTNRPGTAPAWRVLPLLALLATACAESSLNKAELYDTGNFATDGEDTDALGSGPARLRVDVVPNGDSTYLPQSVVIDMASGDAAALLADLDVQLAQTRTLAGRITAFQASPYGDISVPGTSTEPLVGRVGLTAPEGLARKTVDVEDGTFALQLPAGADYRLSIQPEDSAQQPFTIIDPYALLDDETGFDLDLGFGSPVHGRVVQADGTPAPGITEVWLEDLETGLTGPRVATDAEGNYMLRAFEGEYRVAAEGNERSAIPRVSELVTVLEDEAVRVDLDLGTVEPIEATGRVIDADGRALYQATVRFTALSLDEAEGTMVVEDDTDTDGDFELDLLPGTWKVELIPAYDSDGSLAPIRLDDVTVGASGVDLGALYLPERVIVSGVVEGPGGSPQAAVTVVAREIGFDHYVYTAVTGSAGGFEIAVPDVPLEVAYLPPDPKHTVTWIEYPDGMAGRESVTLASGLPVSGRVRSPTGGVGAALVDLVDADTGRSYGTTLTDENGNFDLRIALDEGGGWLEPGAGDTGF